MSTKIAITPDRIMQLGLGFWGSKTFLSAIELGLFTELASGPLKAQELTERLKLHPRSARDFFDALVSLGMLEREDGLYSNTPEADQFLVQGKLGYVGGLLEMANERLYPFWGSLTEGLRTGLPQINFDLPVVGPIFEEYASANGLSDRLKFQAGDFFNEVLPSADVITMGHILHDWNLDEKRMLLRKAYNALPEGGALLVFEALIDDERRQNTFGLLMSLNMLIETPGGFDYTAKDCSGWMREAGFRETRVEHLIGPDSMVVGIK